MINFKQTIIVIFCLFSSALLAEVAPTKKPLTLASISAKAVPNTNELNAPTLAQLIADYDELLRLTKAPDLIEQLRYRQAQLFLHKSELAQELGEALANDEQGYYDHSILTYRTLIKDYPNSEYGQHLYYQLAKAYDLQGDSDASHQTVKALLDNYPDNQYALELYFRSGEYYFSQQAYQQATAAYQHLVTQADSPYFQTALYMMAWSHFKLANNDDALKYFSQLLDVSLPSSPSLSLDISTLVKGNRQLVGDSLEVMAMIFASDKSAQRLSSHYSDIGGRYYEYLVYEILAQRYLDDDQYRDRALTYAAFVQRYPGHVKSPNYALKEIESYQQGQFAKLAYQAKKDFVARYGISGVHWASWSDERRLTVTDTLKSFLNEIAQDYYRAGEKAANSEQKQRLYASASTVFFEYINTFDDDETVAFLYAESLYASGQYAKAITAYEQYAYQQHDSYQAVAAKQADAAYSALLAHRTLSHNEPVPKQLTTLSARELSTLKFIETFRHDKRNLLVLEQLMKERFKANRFLATIESANQMVARGESIGTDKIQDARLLMAHSRFKLGEFALAASEYKTVLGLLAANDKRKNEVTENYAAGLYEQAKVHIAANDLAKGIDWLVAVIEKTPSSSLRKIAQFNAAQYLYQLKEFDRAIAYLDDFRSRFVGDKLGINIPKQIASIYEQQEDWGNAAIEYLAIANNTQDKIEQQQPLYLAAQYFERAGQSAKTLDTYRRYAHAYTRPFDRAVEARFKLSEIYRLDNQVNKRQFWLKRLITIHDKAGAVATSRSKSLAAKSALYFAQTAQQQFNRAKLTLPLRSSLAVKKRRLKQALQAYQKASTYQLASITTESTHQMAEIYRQLAQDLMSSQRPKGLDDLALEQYEILLEEQAYPFEEQAIAIYENNTKRSWQGNYDSWIKQSFAALAAILPGRYNKAETVEVDQDVIY